MDFELVLVEEGGFDALDADCLLGGVMVGGGGGLRGGAQAVGVDGEGESAADVGRGRLVVGVQGLEALWEEEAHPVVAVAVIVIGVVIIAMIMTPTFPLRLAAHRPPHNNTPIPTLLLPLPSPNLHLFPELPVLILLIETGILALILQDLLISSPLVQRQLVNFISLCVVGVAGD